MPHFLRDGKAYWGGLHRELGLLMKFPGFVRRIALKAVDIGEHFRFKAVVAGDERHVDYIKPVFDTFGGFLKAAAGRYWSCGDLAPGRSVTLYGK